MIRAALLSAALLLAWTVLALAQTAVAPSLDPSAMALLSYFGLGKYAAGIASIVFMVGFILTHIMPLIPVPSATAPSWWRSAWQFLAWVTGNYGKVLTALPPAAK